MHIGKRLEVIANMVPQGAFLADIGTDHAYLPVWLLKNNKINKAIAGDIAVGPCQAARNTIAMYNMTDNIEVRQGSGLLILKSNEVDCVTIAGMGGSTIIDILEEAFDVAVTINTLILQPMAGAATLRKWLVKHGWQITDEELVDDAPHFYEIICAKRGTESVYSEAEYTVGPMLIEKKHFLLSAQIKRQLSLCNKLIFSMEKSRNAMESDKYVKQQSLRKALEVMQNEIFGNGK